MEIALLAVLIILVAVNIAIAFRKKPEAVNLAPVVSDVRDEFSRSRSESSTSARETREELNNSFKIFGDTLNSSIKLFGEAQREKFNDFTLRQDALKIDTENKLEKIRETVEKRLTILQEENAKKLEEMRNTVDEKLQSTLEKRFNDSFKLISDRLEQVHKGLGEMQGLASGVGDLKKVLTNVKTRGTLGEVQLGSILEQILSPEQYDTNVSVKSNQERVEYAVKLPDKNEEGKSLLISIDSKFPVEDYQRLLNAYDSGEHDSIETASKAFENSVKKNAKDICEKYINPPVTTDFALMFVPSEGLYAEISRRVGLTELLHRQFKIIVVGPGNLVALLSSLQMGFRTLAIQKRSSEVWGVLGTIKNEFGTFATLLEKTKNQMQTVSNTIDKAGAKARTIERKLKNVQELPSAEAPNLVEEIEKDFLRDEVA